MAGEPKRLVWLVDTIETLRGFKANVRQKLGFALYQAQIGQQHESAKMLRGFAETVWQVRADDPAGTYRAVYAVQFQDAVYVLPPFRRRRSPGSRHGGGTRM